MLKVRAKLNLKEYEQFNEWAIVDVPKEYVNRGMEEYLKNWLIEVLRGKVKADFEIIE